MFRPKSLTLRQWPALLLAASAGLLLVGGLCEQAAAIPVFSRKYETACITCHAGFPKLNSVGMAFKRNGYQFPSDDDLLIKDEPIEMGKEHYEDLWPDSVWPSTLPHLPPVALRGRLGVNQFLDTPHDNPDLDFQFPMDFTLLTSGNFGEDISWYAGMVLAGRGGHGGGGHGGGGHGGAEEAAGLEPELERLFVQFSNLFAWSQYDDDDGMREGHHWLNLPRHALNLRIGQLEPQVVAPWSSIHRQIGITARLPNVATTGTNSFMFEPALRGFELHGVLRQYNSYAVGLVNGNGVGTAWDNNLPKDFYFRVARKWFGYPLDGVLGQAPAPESGGAESASLTLRGQSPEIVAPALDFWREVSFETGFFGYFGRNNVTAEEHEDVIFHGEVHGEEELTLTRLNDFERIGFDARLQYQDWDIFGAWVWGWDDDPGGHEEVEPDELFTWFVEADYVIKPWLTAFGRYEELHFADEEREAEAAIARGVVGAVAHIRVNMRAVGEVVVDSSGKDTTNDAFRALLDFAY